MATPASASIEHLQATWRSIIELCEGFSEDEWARPTGCPGWSVQDNVSHLVDYEARALGRPAPEQTALARPHTKNALGESNEVGVELRRGRSGREVLDELREVSEARSAQLRALTTDDLAREVATPAGPGTLQDMLTLRVMDTWSHEQDIRRATGRPGHLEGPEVDEAILYWMRFLPFVVGKRAGAADGSVVVFEIGDAHRRAIEVVDGRARALESIPDVSTVRLRIPTGTFAALVGGRDDVPDDIAIEGDADLGRRIVDAAGFMP